MSAGRLLERLDRQALNALSFPDRELASEMLRATISRRRVWSQEHHAAEVLSMTKCFNAQTRSASKRWRKRVGREGDGNPVRSGHSLQRRLEKLDSALNILSTEDKWTIVLDRARQLTSDPNSEGPEDDAFWTAMGEMHVRFTIPEMDQLLADA